MANPILCDTKSETELRRKIAAGSQDPENYRNLAEVLLARGHYEEAISLYEQALILPLTNFLKAETSVELGWIFYEIGRQTQAHTLAKEALAVLSNEPERAEVFLCRGASQSLLAHCLMFTDENSGVETARLGLEWLEKAIDSPDLEEKGMAYIDAARLQNLIGNTTKAIDYCKKCLEQDLKEVDRLSCLIVYSQALKDQDRFTEAEKAMKEAVRLVRGYKGILPGLHLELGVIQRSTGRLAEARETLQQALVELRNDPYLQDEPDLLVEIHRALAGVYYELAQYQHAAAAYQEVLRFHSEDDSCRRDAFLWLGHCYLAIGAHDKARDCYEKLLASPNVLPTEKGLAQRALAWNQAKLYYVSGKYPEAAAAFEEALPYYPEDDPNNCNALLWLGYSYVAVAAYPKAQDCFERVLRSPHVSQDEKNSAQQGLSDLPVHTRTGYH